MNPETVYRMARGLADTPLWQRNKGTAHRAGSGLGLRGVR